MCENLIDARKLLANQRKDGEKPNPECFKRSFCEKSRKGIMDGLRHFMKVDNRCALEVGHLKDVFNNEGRSSKRRVPRCLSGKVPRN